MPETGLIVVSNEPIESVYKLASNGLYLPPHVTPLPKKWLAKNPYPEFAQALCKLWDDNQGLVLVTPKPVSFKVHHKSASPFIPPSWLYKSEQIKQQIKQPELALNDIVPGLETPISAACPYTNCRFSDASTQGTIANYIVHLNDHHKWPRERIANWLDTLENVDLRVRKVHAQN